MYLAFSEIQVDQQNPHWFSNTRTSPFAGAEIQKNATNRHQRCGTSLAHSDFFF